MTGEVGEGDRRESKCFADGGAPRSGGDEEFGAGEAVGDRVTVELYFDGAGRALTGEGTNVAEDGAERREGGEVLVQDVAELARVSVEQKRSAYALTLLHTLLQLTAEPVHRCQ